MSDGIFGVGVGTLFQNGSAKSYRMTKIGPLWITCENGYIANQKNEDLYFVHACKEPYHRIFVGYKTNGCPKDNKEYLYAVRGNRLALNIVDCDNPSWFNDVAIDYALNFMDAAISDGYDVLVHCNQGLSRGPSIGLLWLVRSKEIKGTTDQIIEKFKSWYPQYKPAIGIGQYTRNRIQQMVN